MTVATPSSTESSEASSARPAGASPAAPILEARGLTKRFSVGWGPRKKQVHALEDVSFRLERGHVAALVGESGSGKSTAARIVARLLAPTAGKFFVDGQDVLAEEPRRASLAYRSKVQMIFQDPFGSLNPVHTVRHHVERPLVVHGRASGERAIADRVHALLSTVGLEPAADFAAKFPHELSGGQRQRVAIARALAVDPSLVLADEPISMLDVSIRMGILNLMDQLRTERNLSYLYITHDLASARYIADETMVMYAGHMVEAAESDELMSHPAHPYTELLLSSVPQPEEPLTRRKEARSEPPSLVDPGPGCPFAARCPKAIGACRAEMPRVTPLGGRHWVRCHLYPG